LLRARLARTRRAALGLAAAQLVRRLLQQLHGQLGQHAMSRQAVGVNWVVVEGATA
jgi:hypothetical protein